MSEPANSRKTYMMLSETNAEKFIINPDDGKIISEYPSTYTAINETKTKDLVNGTVTVTKNNVTTPLYTFRFPEEFINSKNPRWVEVHHVKAIYDGNETKDIILHSDIIKRDPYLDRSVMVCNETRTKYKKYAFQTHDRTFTLWFTSFAHPDTPLDSTKLTFMAELMLIY